MNDELEIGFGADPSKADKRDARDAELSLAYPFAAAYDTHIDMLNVEYQRKVGACTASLKSYVEYLYYRKTGKYVRLSMAFLYVVTKLYIDQNLTEGSSLRSALKAAQKYGVATEDSFPTDFTKSHAEFLMQPIPKGAWDSALEYRIGGYVSIPVERSCMAAAIDKYGLLYARYEVGSEWYTAKDGRVSWRKEDVLPLRAPKSVISGHAIILSGYDLTSEKAAIRGRNTWSDQWADRGNFLAYHEDYPITEAWAVTLDSVMPFVAPAVPGEQKVVDEKTWRGILAILRKFNIIK
jgi:hypothetical protein